MSLWGSQPLGQYSTVQAERSGFADMDSRKWIRGRGLCRSWGTVSEARPRQRINRELIEAQSELEDEKDDCGFNEPQPLAAERSAANRTGRLHSYLSGICQWTTACRIDLARNSSGGVLSSRGSKVGPERKPAPEGAGRHLSGLARLAENENDSVVAREVAGEFGRAAVRDQRPVHGL